MAKLTYTNNGITFGDVKIPVHYTQGIAAGAPYTVDGKTAGSRVTGEIDTAIQSFNAIDIDWNGAQLGDKEINTAGELLSH